MRERSSSPSQISGRRAIRFALQIGALSKLNHPLRQAKEMFEKDEEIQCSRGMLAPKYSVKSRAF